MVNHDSEYTIAKKRMIQEQIMARGIKDQRVIKAMSVVPRHIFVDDALKSQAYIDAPLNIGEGQTISQPYIVALMTQTLSLSGQEKVLEIGTGCGYQTVLLSQLTKQVYTIERIKPLAMQARSRFKKLGVRNVIMRIGDGSLGWQEGAPFDRILVTCAAPIVPEALLGQLSENGFMIIPVAAKHGEQDLWKITKTKSGFQKENLGPCRFVKMVGEQGY